MGTFAIKGRPTFLGKLDMSLSAHTIAIEFGAEEQDDTVLDDTTRSMKGGLFTFGFSMDCFFDGDVEGITIANIGSDVPLTFATVDGTEQEIAYLINCKELMSSPLSGAVGDMAGLNVAGNAADRLVRGILELNATKTSSGNSTGVQQGLVSSTQRIYGSLHVHTVSGTGPTLDVIIQSDNAGGFGTPTNRLTFTRAIDVTSEFLSLAGEITDDDYWRVNFTIGGSDTPTFGFAVSFGII